MNYILVGNAGAGKDTVASLIPNHLPISFASPIKKVAKLLRLNKLDEAYDIMAELFDYKLPRNMKKKLMEFSQYPFTPKDRKLLQDLGTNWARKHDPLVWVKGLARELNPDKNYVITDCRFENELVNFPQFVSVFIACPEELRVERMEKRDGKVDLSLLQHESEKHIAELALLTDVILDNNCDMYNLKLRVQKLLDETKEGLEETPLVING